MQNFSTLNLSTFTYPVERLSTSCQKMTAPKGLVDLEAFRLSHRLALCQLAPFPVPPPLVRHPLELEPDSPSLK